MAEEEEGRNNKICEVKAIGNSWIICRSQSHSGRVYYFNTFTGKSAWNLSDGETEKAQLVSGGSGSHVGDCPEPPEPPGDTPHCRSHQKAPPKDGGATIYNKQIINNQFAKPYAIPPFQNANCSCGSLNPRNDISMNLAPLYNPAMWAMPPPHPVFLAPTISGLANQAQPIFSSPDVPVQDTSVPVHNYYQIGNQMVNQNHQRNQEFHKTKFTKYRPRWNQNSQRNFQNNSNNDLRDILSARRKDQRSYLEETEQKEVYENHGNNSCESENSKISADDLYPSDIDEEWLQANTIVDISCAWRDFSGADCCIVVANTHVMLNNKTFLSHFIKPEKQIYLLTPIEVIKQLRSATGDTDRGSRLARRARNAIRFAVLQMDKVPAGIKNLQNRTIEKCCLELVEQNYHVLLLVNGNELLSQTNIEGVSMFTIYQFKEYLNEKCNKSKAGIHENITVTIRQNNISEKTINQSTPEAIAVDEAENRDELNVIQHKEIEIQTEQITPLKKTANACVQTDFEVSPTIEILKSPIFRQALNKEIVISPILGEPLSLEILKSTSVQTVNTEMVKSPIAVQPLSTETIKSPHLNEPSEIDQKLKTDVIVKSSNDTKEASEVVTRKIRLKRNNNILAKRTSPVKKTQFRWRKQKAKPPIIATASPKAVVNNQSFSVRSPPSSLVSISDLLPLLNGNVSDIAKSIEFSDTSVVKTPEAVLEAVIEESSVDEISNSIDHDNIPKINKNAILSQSRDNEKEDIVMFEVTSDLIDDNISRGSDEWVSRFVQIMEEALTQILQQEPRFFDLAMPPPWTVYEATVCIKTKFKENSKIAFACNECGNFLLKISDGSGKIFADLNSHDFMRMYSYGVYLITALQSLLNDSEDLKIAKESLSELLKDIRNPNLFLDYTESDRQDFTANVSELVTDLRDDFAADANISPPKKQKQASIEPSPSKYNLRSSQRSNETNEMRIPNGFQNMNIDESFFASLQLQKTSTSSDNRLAAEYHPFSPPQQISLTNHLTGGSKEDTEENEVKTPKIIRKFTFRPDIEEKLKSRSHYSDDDNYYGDDNFYYTSNKKAEWLSQYGSEDLPCTKSDMIGAQMFQWFTQKTTYQVHKVLAEVHGFCEDSVIDLYSKEKMDQQYKIYLTEKATKLHKCLNDLCDNLKSVLCRKDTKAKVDEMLADLGFINCEISHTQVAEYGVVVQKYLDKANILVESLNLIAIAIREKK